MSKHTEGPWSIHPYSNKEPFVVAPQDGSDPWVAYSVAIGSGEKMVASVNMQTSKKGYPTVTNLQECDANARLIAKAPEMLVMLKESLSVLERDHKTSQDRLAFADKVRALIAEVEGI